MLRVHAQSCGQKEVVRELDQHVSLEANVSRFFYFLQSFFDFSILVVTTCLLRGLALLTLIKDIYHGTILIIYDIRYQNNIVLYNNMYYYSYILRKCTKDKTQLS